MYWQVYLHKTVVACEQMLVETLRRAKIGLWPEGFGCSVHRPAAFPQTPPRSRFLQCDPAVLNDFLRLDDHDIMGAVKVWADHPDTAPCRNLAKRPVGTPQRCASVYKKSRGIQRACAKTGSNALPGR
jgi:hypothetical protein